MPLFKLMDEVMKVKLEVDDMLDSSGAVVIEENHPKAGFSGWGQEAVSALFRPLQSTEGDYQSGR